MSEKTKMSPAKVGSGKLLYPLLFFLHVAQGYRHGGDYCSKSEYERCVRIASPLIKEAHMVFPDNMDDIDVVCRTWNNLVDCLKRYTEQCFTEDQRRQFNKAVENPIESVHQMCMHPQYQKEYLQHAPCIKSTITEKSHCGSQYSLLVDQVAQGEVISKSVLCCSYDRFRQCVEQETRRLCDRGLADGPAARFASQTIEKAHSFFHDQCFNYIPNSGDCSTLSTDALPFSDPFSISTSSSELSSWSTVQDVNAKEAMPADRMTPPRATSITWLPSSTVADNQNPMTAYSVLGSRTRPASYGRSSSWMEGAGNRQNTVQMGRGGEITMTPPTDQERGTLEPRFFGREFKESQNGVETAATPRALSLNSPDPADVTGDYGYERSSAATAATADADATSEEAASVGDVTTGESGGDDDHVIATTGSDGSAANFHAEAAMMADEPNFEVNPTEEATPIREDNEETSTPGTARSEIWTPGLRLGYRKQVAVTSPITETTPAVIIKLERNDSKLHGNSWKNAPDATKQGAPTAAPPPMTSSETWYPAAGNQMVNEVDEPNQQGLKKPKNSAAKTSPSAKQILSLTVIATVLTAYC